MKLILAIIHDKDSEIVSEALITANFRVTRIASSGGFLRRGSTTFMIGVEEDRLDEAVRVVRDNCLTPAEPNQKRASLFILNVASFDHF